MTTGQVRPKDIVTICMKFVQEGFEEVDLELCQSLFSGVKKNIRKVGEDGVTAVF